MGAMIPPNRKSCYNFRVIEINRVLDGDTIDVTIDLGFDLYKKERVRVVGVDTPEKRTRDLEEKRLESTQPTETKEKLEGAIAGDDDLVIRTEACWRCRQVWSSIGLVIHRGWRTVP